MHTCAREHLRTRRLSQRSLLQLIELPPKILQFRTRALFFFSHDANAVVNAAAAAAAAAEEAAVADRDVNRAHGG